MSKTYVNWGIIGCARIALNYMIPAIRKSKVARLHAVASRSQKKPEVVKDNSIRLYDTYEAILNDENIDAIYIPLPNSMHLEWVLKAARNKKHILCEKPLGLTAKEVAEMKEAADKYRVIVMEAFAYRYSPILTKVKEIIGKGEIGELKMIEMHNAFMLEGEDDYRLQRKYGGGAVYDVGCYNFDFLRFLTGRAPGVIHTFPEIHPVYGVDMSCINVFEFDGGLKGISVCAMNHQQFEGYKIIGEEGMIEINHDYNACGNLKITLIKENKKEHTSVYCPDNYMLEIEHISKHILKNNIQFIDFERSYQTALITDSVISEIY